MRASALLPAGPRQLRCRANVRDRGMHFNHHFQDDSVCKLPYVRGAAGAVLCPPFKMPHCDVPLRYYIDMEWLD